MRVLLDTSVTIGVDAPGGIEAAISVASIGGSFRARTGDGRAGASV